ncbi:MAG: efflux RND transporter periplasmic adaptor subunit [Phycisphaerales bacterium]|nr:efflux RND transporter periplasmic adaptor subunit [Phycisphaerales bacterium]
MLSRGRRVIAPLAIVAVVALVWIAVGASGGEQEGVQGTPAEIGVTAFVVEARSIPFAPSYIGRTEASQTVEIRARVRGFLNERLFREGSTVGSTDELFKIDRRPFEAEVAVGKARISAAEAKLDRAYRQLERYRELFEKDAATSTELEEWETEYLTALADVELFRAELVKSELDLSYTTIKSPIDGVIGRSLRDVGSFVDDGANSLLAVVEQVDPIYVTFSMSERELLRWRSLRTSGRITGPERDDVSVQTRLSDGDTHPHEGRLSFVDVAVDRSTSTVTLRATVPNPDRTLRPGQSVGIRMLGFERVGVLIVPKGAVLQTPTTASVYVIDQDGTVHARAVDLGEWHEDGWIIESGLSEGEVIAVDNLLRLRPGSPVNVTGRHRLGDPETEQQTGRIG